MVLTEMLIGGRWRVPTADEFVAIGYDATLLAATVTTELARARPSTPDLRGGQT